MNTDSKQILSAPLKIGGLTAKNRFCIQPMECCDADYRGIFKESTFRRYIDYCCGGASLVVMESVTLQYDSRSTENQLLLDVSDLENKRIWTAFMKNMKTQFPDTIIIVQLNHAGEYSSDEFSRRICVKPYPGFGGKLVDADYVDGVIDAYTAAAEFLYSIGCDGVDLKFCHGYLGSQILRPYNDRDWKYGGSWENRSRFAFDMCEKIRSRISDKKFLIGAKISVYEGISGGQGHASSDSSAIDVSETLLLCSGLEERGASFFIESLGSARTTWKLMAPGPDCPENVFLHLAAAKLLKQNCRPETVIIGGGLSILGEELFTVCAKCISDGVFDMAAIGRQALADPYLPQKFMQDNSSAVNWCKCCDACGNLLIKQTDTHCVWYKR